MSDDPISSLAQWIGSSPETASTISGVVTPALEGGALGAIGGAMGGNAGLGALAGAGAGAIGGGLSQALSSATPGVSQAGAAPVGSSAVSAPASVGAVSPDATVMAKTSYDVGGDTGGAIGSRRLDSFDGWGESKPGPQPGATTGGLTGGAVTGGSTTPTQGAGPTSLETAFKDPTLGNILKAAGGNLGPLVSGGSFLTSALSGNKAYPGEAQLANTAARLASQGEQLGSYLTSGTLPPAVQASLNRSGEAAKAAIRSQYAARGQTGSDAETRDLANVDTSIVSQGADIATKLLSQGVSESGLSAQLYQTIMNQAMQDDASLGQALSAFTQSLATSGQPITLQVAR